VTFISLFDFQVLLVFCSAFDKKKQIQDELLLFLLKMTG